MKDLSLYKQKIIEAGDMCLDFAKTRRVTFLQDGVTLESDTDHTVMLSIIACALAKEFYPDMDLGKISNYAIVHDLVEVYAGDTDTVNITKDQILEKEKREQASFEKINSKFSNILSWIPETIKKYESQDDKESRYVKVLDKLMSEITNVLNNNAYFKIRNKDKDFIVSHFESKKMRINDKLQEFKEIEAIFYMLAEDVINRS